jgi:hypothetical protein
MQIFIQHVGQQTGPFSVDQVRSGLASGIYQSSDLAWHEGAPGWLPLSVILGIGNNPPPALPVCASANPAGTRTSPLAIWSLVLGILALPTVGLAAIPAVICGHLALGNIKKSAGTQTGGGLAIAGLITGYLGILILGVAMLAGLTAPMVIKQRNKANQIEAVNNAKQVGIAMFEFETEYGNFPDDSTASAVADATNTPKISGNSANDRFRQLIRAGISQSEILFYAHVPGVRKPDGLIDGDNALAPGECGFAYVGNLVTTDEVSRPIAMTPLIPGTQRFDYKPFDGKAVILWTDNSVSSLPIDRKTGEVMLDGKSLLDPSHPIWGGKPPVIALPE